MGAQRVVAIVEWPGPRDGAPVQEVAVVAGPLAHREGAVGPGERVLADPHQMFGEITSGGGGSAATTPWTSGVSTPTVAGAGAWRGGGALGGST